MKKLLIPLFFFLIGLKSYAVEETISYFDQSGDLTAYQNMLWQFARFEPEAPCYIKEITVYFFGQSGQATVVLLGHEGGQALPGIFTGTNLEKFIAAWTVSPSPPQGQVQGIRIQLPEPVYFADDQFFIGVGGLSGGLFFATDRTQVAPSCESESGGTFMNQVVINSSQEWQLGGYSYAASALVEYPSKNPHNYFKDVTSDLGFPTGLSRSSYAAADFDKDGDLDILISGKLFKNNSGESFTDVTEEYGLAGSASGNAFVDFDNDGDQDVVLLQSGGGKCYVYKFDPESDSFEQIELSTPTLQSLTCFSFEDVDLDGYPDLFLGQLWGDYPLPLPNYLMRNTGGNDVEDATVLLYPQWDGEWNYPNEAWNPDQYIVDRNRNSRGCGWCDFDDDGDRDFFVTNYFLQEDEFYENLGDALFDDICTDKGIDQNATGHNHGTGVDWSDYDADGDFDLGLSQFAHPRFLQSDHRPMTIYNNSGAPNYDFVDTYDPATWTSSLGITFEETSAGIAFGDANNDGLQDFVKTTFYGCRFIDFYEQTQDNKFVNKTWDYGLDKIVTGEDAMWFDFDQDGKLDLAMSENGKFRLFRNAHSSQNSWSQVELESKTANKFAIGARVKVYVGSKRYVQEVNCGRGQKMQNPYRLHFGLGSATEISKIEVRWPGSSEYETFTNIPINSIVRLVEGEPYAPDVPEVPVLSYPENGAVEVSLQASLRWQASIGASQYKVKIADNPDLTDPIVDETVSQNEYPISELAEQTSYYWTVSAGNDVGFSEYAEPRGFTTGKVSGVQSAESAEFYLSEIAPNPVTDQAKLEFGTRKSGKARLALYDSQGELQSVLFEGELSPGDYEILRSFSGIANGSYILEFTMGNQSKIEKIVVAK